MAQAMYASLVLAAAVAMAQIMPVRIPFGKPRQVVQPRAPIETAGPGWARACEGSDDWDKPAPPVRIHGNAYYVGTCGISAIFIADKTGHVLIDGGTERGADLIAANIQALGYRPSDIRFILISHEHHDHVGGVAKLQRISGAHVVASAAATRVLATGLPAAGDPQFGVLKPFPAVQVDRVVRDGEEVRIGEQMLTMIATPGHTAGATSWRWVSCDGGVCRMMVYADSLTPVSNDAYRFSDHPKDIAAFRASIAKIAASPCEILVTPHPSASKLGERFAAGKPLLDEGACKAYAADRSRLLDERLAEEASGKKQ